MNARRSLVLVFLAVTVACGVFVFDGAREVILKRKLGANYEGPLAE